MNQVGGGRLSSGLLTKIVGTLQFERLWQRQAAMEELRSQLTGSFNLNFFEIVEPSDLLQGLLRGPLRKDALADEIERGSLLVSALFISASACYDLENMWRDARAVLARVKGPGEGQALEALAMSCFLGSNEEDEKLDTLLTFEDIIAEKTDYDVKIEVGTHQTRILGAVRGWTLLAGLVSSLEVERSVVRAVGRPLRRAAVLESSRNEGVCGELRFAAVQALGVALERVSDDHSSDDELYFDEESEDGDWGFDGEEVINEKPLRPAMAKVAKCLRRIVEQREERRSGRRTARGDRDGLRSVTLEASASIDRT